MNFPCLCTRRTLSAFLAFALVPAAVTAQTSPATDPGSGEEEIVMLSPFVVSATTDTGYLATDSLAGTRLRTPLKDIAASVSVVTKDFLRDTGATDLFQVLTYTTGTEVNGVGGNFSGFTAGGDGGNNYAVRREVNPTTRVRGLAAADLTRNFFASGIPLDSYNTESATINRGANSILFGLGSPAGIIDNATLLPRFTNRTALQARADGNGSIRASFDTERMLVDQKLSLRVAGLHDQRKYEQEPSFRDQDRLYAALTYRPFRNTTIRFNGEFGQIKQSLPRTDPPVDGLSPWWYYGKIAKESPLNLGPSFAVGAFLGDPAANPTSNFERYKNMDAGAGSWFANPGVLYSSPSNGAPSDSFVANADRAANQPAAGDIAEQWRFSAPQVSGVYRPDLYGTVLSGFMIAPQITDRSIFDYRKQLIDGPNSGTTLDFDAFNIAAEQLLFDGHAGVELVYDQQHRTTEVFEAMDTNRANRITVDHNRQTVDGRPNPNFGRPFISSRGLSSRSYNDSEDLRATAFVRYDFAEKSSHWLLRFLGEHTVTGFYQDSVKESFGLSALYAALDPTFASGSGSTALNDRTISSLVYLGPSLAGAASPVGAHLQPVQARLMLPESISTWTYNRQNGYKWTFTPATVYQYPDFEHLTTGTSASRDEVESSGLVWQGNLWNNLFVSTLGWRHDTVKNFTGRNTSTNPATGAIYTARPAVSPALSVSNNLFSQGYALHVPPRWLQRVPGRIALSFYLNESENFQVTGFRQDALGRPIDPQAGTTKETGIGLTLLDGKFVVRAAKYRTDQINQADSTATAILGQFAQLEQRLQSTNTQQALAAAGYVGFGLGSPSALYSQYLSSFNMRASATTPTGTNLLFNNPTGFTSTTSTVSEGHELELIYNPLRNWRIMLNVARQEATYGAPDPLVAALIADRAPYWNLPAVRDLIASPGWTTIRYADNFINNPGALRTFQTGSPTPELREWHANLITNYQFDNGGRLKGWGVGGAVRWLDEIAIGYPVITDPVLGAISDVKHPFMGADQTTVDAWLSYERTFKNKRFGWRIQLNVRNVLNDNLLVAVRADPIAIGNVNDYIVPAYRIGEARTFEVTSTLTF